MKDRLKNDGFGSGQKKNKILELAKLNTYKNDSELP